MPQAGSYAFMAGDVDGDGKIAASDVVLMLERLVGVLGVWEQIRP
jgi:hypothetical protein